MFDDPSSQPPRRLCIHGFLPFSYANGPGCRAAIWLQGCSLNCPRCFNPQTHAFDQGRWVAVDELVGWIRALGRQIEGVTVSGGEPLQQRPAVTELLRRIKALTPLSVILFTGFTWDEVQRMPTVTLARGRPACEAGDAQPAAVPLDHDPSGGASPIPSILAYVDILIAGRYDATRHLASGLRGSANKTVHFLTDRYCKADLNQLPCGEAIIGADGRVVVTGVEPASL